MASKTLKFRIQKYRTILKVCKRAFFILLQTHTHTNCPLSEYFVDGPDKGRGEWKSVDVKNLSVNQNTLP